MARTVNGVTKLTAKKEFELNNLLDRISGDLKEAVQQSHHKEQSEYRLNKPVIEQREKVDGIDRIQNLVKDSLD